MQLLDDEADDDILYDDVLLAAVDAAVSRGLRGPAHQTAAASLAFSVPPSKKLMITHVSETGKGGSIGKSPQWITVDHNPQSAKPNNAAKTGQWITARSGENMKANVISKNSHWISENLQKENCYVQKETRPQASEDRFRSYQRDDLNRNTSTRSRNGDRNPRSQQRHELLPGAAASWIGSHAISEPLPEKLWTQEQTDSLIASNGLCFSGIAGVAVFKQYQEAAMQTLVPGDYVMMQGKPFIKKSGWRKIAFFFNISFEIKEKDIQADPAGNVMRAEFVVRASMLSGRFTDAWGSCDRGEKRFSKPNHDIPSTAETRAKNRACQLVIPEQKQSILQANAVISCSVSAYLSVKQTLRLREAQCSSAYESNDREVACTEASV